MACILYFQCPFRDPPCPPPTAFVRFRETEEPRRGKRRPFSRRRSHKRGERPCQRLCRRSPAQRDSESQSLAPTDYAAVGCAWWQDQSYKLQPTIPAQYEPPKPSSPAQVDLFLCPGLVLPRLPWPCVAFLPALPCLAALASSSSASTTQARSIDRHPMVHGYCGSTAARGKP